MICNNRKNRFIDAYPEKLWMYLIMKHSRQDQKRKDKMNSKLKLTMIIILVFLVPAAVQASSNDHFLIKSDNYRFQVYWLFVIESEEIYNIAQYWPLFDLFSQNWEIMKNRHDMDIFAVNFKDGEFVLHADYQELSVEVFRHRDFRKIIEYMRTFLVDKYSLSYTQRSYDRIYKISIPFRQGSEYPSYSDAAVYSEFAFGANTSYQNQYHRGYNLIYFDHDRLLKTESIIQRYNYTMHSQILTADNLEKYLFTGPEDEDPDSREGHDYITYEQALKLKTGMKKEKAFELMGIPYDTVMGYYEQDIYGYFGFGEFSTHTLRLHFIDDKLVQVSVDVYGPMTIIDSYESLSDYKRDFP